MKLIKYTALAIALSLAGGCSFEAVPPTAKGKILTTAGYTPEYVSATSFTPAEMECRCLNRACKYIWYVNEATWEEIEEEASATNS